MCRADQFCFYSDGWLWFIILGLILLAPTLVVSAMVIHLHGTTIKKCEELSAAAVSKAIEERNHEKRIAAVREKHLPGYSRPKRPKRVVVNPRDEVQLPAKLDNPLNLEIERKPLDSSPVESPTDSPTAETAVVELEFTAPEQARAEVDDIEDTQRLTDLYNECDPSRIPTIPDILARRPEIWDREKVSQ